MRSVSLLWGRNLIEKGEADKEKRTCAGTSFGYADLNLEYSIIVLIRFIILTN